MALRVFVGAGFSVPVRCLSSSDENGEDNLITRNDKNKTSSVIPIRHSALMCAGARDSVYSVGGGGCLTSQGDTHVVLFYHPMVR